MDTVAPSQHRHFIYIAIGFVVVLVLSNTIAAKLVQIGPFVLSAAIIVFPISYIFGDILTEVYGYRASRKIIWSGFAALIVMSLVYYVAALLPPVSFWQNQEAFVTILGSVPRIALASMTAYFFGEFANSYVLSRMKVWMEGRSLWMRTIGSTVVGEGVDTAIFYIIAFAGVIPFAGLIAAVWSAYLVKVAYEVIATPITYAVVKWLKRAEGIDIYDRGISYSPFTLAE